MADEEIREGDAERPRKKKPAPPPDDDDDEDFDDRRKKIRKRSDDGGVGAVIPYRNGMALAAYYTGVFGLIACFLGPLALLGVVPIVLGVLGLMKAKKDPEARGSAHAWIGIGLGALELLTGCAGIGFIIFAIASGPRR